MAEKTCGMAIASLILGILSILIGWIPVLGWLIILTGLGLGIAALVKISKDKNLKGKGLAIAGIVLSSIGLFFFVILFGIGALAYFGVMSPERFLPEKCTMPSGIVCLDFTIDETGIVQVYIQNSMGFEMTSVQATLVNSNCTSQIESVTNGARVTLVFSGCNVGQSGSKFNDDLNIAYTNADYGLSHIAAGSLVAKIA